MKNVEKNSKIKVFGIISGVLLIIAFGIGRAQAQDHWDSYFQSILVDPPEAFIVSGLQNISENGNGKVAIDLGSGVGHETKLLLQKGYKVIAIDSNPRVYPYMLSQPGISQYKSNLQFIGSKFENINFEKLPRTDLVISSFALPFVSKHHFNRVWQNIVATIKPGGYIIVNLFDSKFSFYNNKYQMTFHSKNEAKALFSNFKIISFREMRSDPLKPGNQNHYYVIVAKKLY
jgi:tellurite methyltransferase